MQPAIFELSKTTLLFKFMNHYIMKCHFFNMREIFEFKGPSAGTYIKTKCLQAFLSNVFRQCIFTLYYCLDLFLDFFQKRIPVLVLSFY